MYDDNNIPSLNWLGTICQMTFHSTRVCNNEITLDLTTVAQLEAMSLTALKEKQISSFLGGRTQAVVLEGECSSEVSVISSVPQCSVLGPLLFLLYMYINDLPENIQLQVRLFANDNAVHLTECEKSK